MRLPISDLTREKPRDIRLIGPDGRYLPFLTRSEERLILATAIAEAARNFDDEQFGTIPVSQLAPIIQYAIDQDYATHPPLGWGDWRDLVQIPEADRRRPPEPGDEWLVEDGVALLRHLVYTHERKRLLFALPEVDGADAHFSVEQEFSESITIRAVSWLARRALSKERGEERQSVFQSWKAPPSRAGQRPDYWLVLADGSARQVDRMGTATLDVQQAARDDDQGHANARQGDDPHKLDRGALYTKNALTEIYTHEWALPNVMLPDTYVVTIPIEDYLHCESYHVQVGVPPSVYIHSAKLRVLRKATSRKTLDPKSEDRFDSELIIINDDDLHPGQAHLHFSRRLSNYEAPDPSFVSGDVRLVLRPSYHNGTRAGMYLSWLALLVMLALFSSVAWPAVIDKCMICLFSLSQINTEAVVSLLVLLPSIAIAYLIRQEEDELTKSIHARYRRRLAYVAVVLFITSLVMSLGPNGWFFFCASLVGVIVVAHCVLVITLSAKQSKAAIDRIRDGQPTKGRPGR